MAASLMRRTLTILLLIALLAFGCTSKTDNAGFSTYVARNWMEANIDLLSQRLATPVSEAYPAVPSFALQAVLKSALSGIRWQYEPRRLSSENWLVEVTTSFRFTVPIVNETVDVKGGLELRTDTKNARVIDVSINPRHFALTRSGQPATRALASAPPAPVEASSQGPTLSILNECSHPIRVAVSFRTTSGERKYTAISFGPMESARLEMPNSDAPVRVTGGSFLVYAETTDGSGIVWEGSRRVELERAFRGWDKSELNMREVTLENPSTESHRHRLTCEN
jgi:hypothetical protein